MYLNTEKISKNSRNSTCPFQTDLLRLFKDSIQKFTTKGVSSKIPEIYMLVVDNTERIDGRLLTAVPFHAFQPICIAIEKYLR